MLYLKSLPGLVSLLLLGTVTLPLLTPPLPVHAATERLTVTLSPRRGEGFQDLLTRAETIAQEEIQRTFNADVVVGDVSLVVMGEHGGLTTPLLSVDVRRDLWRRNPQLSDWAQYYSNARQLLGFNGPSVENTQASGDPVLGSGDVQVTLRWNTIDDLDLAVRDPNGDTIFFAEPSSPSGGQLDVDSNAGCMSRFQNPVENIFWNSGNAPEGRYVATVSLFTRCNDSRNPIPFELSITLNGDTQTETGTVSDQSPSQSFEFVFP
ncbi:hypothetical protein NEA10_05305 [Phormidium yuhuli AB48]|uniref:DUF2135 domain-containing protein n=1 Tax=Phormidium yuhuli AB48 TaxID=2940671 RepID=A0ABY5ASE6_9CYAN|nr:hypothetical protein [Phormidium yuhuli]USR92143.1 hypothetical protein NEA10_05305 [Phormidium yuhuli AB48]